MSYIQAEHYFYVQTFWGGILYIYNIDLYLAGNCFNSMNGHKLLSSIHFVNKSSFVISVWFHFLFVNGSDCA